MGVETKQEQYTEEDHARFKERLHTDLRALEEVLKRPGFGCGPCTIGAELELELVDEQGRARGISQDVVRAAKSPSITPEMGVFNIEVNTPPVLLAGAPFSALREALRASVTEIQAHAAQHGGRVVPVGILPTLRREDFHSGAITDRPRYRSIVRGIRELRKTPSAIHIEGEDTLHLELDDAVVMEAANTSFQVHLRTDPDEFADLFNAALLLTGPVLAAAANAPTFLGHRLWHETRIALFKQAGDDRPFDADADARLPARVTFGDGWVRDGAYELFTESVALHQPLLPEAPEEEAHSAEPSGALPKLAALRLHHGTVWNWNRPIYDPAGDGHLRIELRAMPAGPSYDDMLANASFLLGAILGLKGRVKEMIAAFPFALARRNFYLAAQRGLDAELVWPAERGAPESLRAGDLLLRLLPCAREGLTVAGVDREEIDHFLGIFEARVRSGQTGATWQLAVLRQLNESGIEGYPALTALLERYIEGFASGRPVHLWPVDG